MENKSLETLMWEDIIKEITLWYKRDQLTNSGKMIAKYPKSELISNLKHKYFIDLMKHNINKDGL